MTIKTAVPQPYHITDDGGLSLDFHPGQWKAWDSDRRFVIVLAGTQGGKTSWGPHWLYREIQRRGPGDYLVVTPTYPLLNLKALPEFLKLFQTLLKLGSHAKADKVFTFDAIGERRTWGSEQDQPTRVIFGHAQDPEGLESATAKAAWLDEAGQNKFKLGSFEAIMRRLSLAQGRVLITTTPYNLGWLKQLFWDKQHERDDVDVIRFDSTENPAFPQEEMDRARRDLPRWKFDMFYRAIFTRPAGMIYDCFDPTIHKVPAFSPPAFWPRYIGLDFGGVNTAAVFIAEEGKREKREGQSKPVFVPSGRYFVYREYHAGSKTAKEHTADLLRGEGTIPRAYGGASSEGQWRQEFSAAGLIIAEPPIKDVEVGINRVYAGFKNDELFICDDCTGLLDEVGSYARELDDMGEPTEKIADKETYHKADALRYIMCHLRQRRGHELPPQPKQKSKWKNIDNRTGGRWGKF